MSAAFFGSSEHKVDRKGRVSIPAAFRQELTGQTFAGIVAFPSRRGAAIEACGADEMTQKIKAMDFDLLENTAADEPPAIYYDLQRLPFDPEGRIILPASLREFAGIEDQTKFVGIGKTFQIWSPRVLTEHRAKKGGAS